MNIQEVFADKQHQQLNGKITYDELYLWLAEQLGVTVNWLPVSMETIRKSTDAYLNDIPLKLWDNCDSFVRSMAVRAGFKSWALSYTVSLLKCFAKAEVSK